jgi:predicted short-subunit dehydrogenase-like oxidoreductase (DUF2520 family)
VAASINVSTDDVDIGTSTSILTLPLQTLNSLSHTTGVRGNEIADELARDGSVLRFVLPESAFGVSRQDIRRRIRRWMVNQHWIWWRGLGNTQRQGR